MCMTPQPSKYPNLNLAFNGARNAIDINNSYIEMLEATGIHDHSQYAAKLHEFTTAEKKKQALKKEYNTIKSFLKSWSKKHGVLLDFTARKKDWIGFNAKILLYLKTGKSLEKIRDLLGFRIILLTEYPDTAKSHQLAYQLQNDLFDFLKSRHCLLLEAEPKSGKPLDIEKKPPNVFIYPKNEIKSEYSKNVKNYMIEPKEDFYQGLHSYILTPSGITLEIQIHTTATAIQAEKLHELYKTKRYQGIDIVIDYKTLNLPGLVVGTDGKIIFDKLGIFKPNFKFLE